MVDKKQQSYRSTASFGKRQEYIAVAELLKRNYDVYMTLVDDQQIDCILRFENNNIVRYTDIQIKARSKTCKNPGYFPQLVIKNPRDSYFFMLFAERSGDYWIIPSHDLAGGLANVGKTGKNKGIYKIKVANERKDGSLSPREKFEKYRNKFELLENHAQAH